MASSLQQFYDQYHQKNKHFNKVIGENNFTYFFFLRLFKKKNHSSLQNFISSHSDTNSAKKILDIGCGVGTLSLYFAFKGFKVVGIDVSQRAINIAQSAKKSLSFNNVTFKKQKLAQTKGKFDLIICSEIIEHIPDDKTFVSQISDRLKKNGLLILSTRSQSNWLTSVGFFKKHDQAVGHLRRYSKENLLNLFPTQDWRVDSLQTIEGPIRSILFTTKLGWLIKFIHGPLVPLFHWLDWLLTILTGSQGWLMVIKKVR